MVAEDGCTQDVTARARGGGGVRVGGRIGPGAGLGDGTFLIWNSCVKAWFTRNLSLCSWLPSTTQKLRSAG